MKIKDIITILNAQLLTPQADLEQEVHTACGSDMMSDVLAYVKDQSALITGLTNPQVVRTAEMMDMICIIFVHGNWPDVLSGIIFFNQLGGCSKSGILCAIPPHSEIFHSFAHNL